MFLVLCLPFAMGTSKQTPIQVGRRKREESGGSRSVVVLVLALVAIIKKWNGVWHEEKQTKIIEQGLTRVVAVVVVVRALTIKTPEKKNKNETTVNSNNN